MINKNSLLIIFLIISLCGVSQNRTHSYVSDFARLQGEVEKEFGRENARTINYSSLTKDSKPYSLQVIGTSDYESFLKNTKIHDVVRILYLDKVNFKSISHHVFDKLKTLRAIEIDGCKNINFDDLVSNLVYSKKLEQLHFERMKFGDWQINVNKLSELKVLTFDDCCFKEFSKMSLNLDEFSISYSKNRLDLSSLFITSVKKVNIKNSSIKTFPYSLSTSKGLENLDLTNTKIKNNINNKIKGFISLLFLDVTDTKINFKNLKFIDNNKRLFIGKGADILELDGAL
jgi:hypothetical protein